MHCPAPYSVPGRNYDLSLPKRLTMIPQIYHSSKRFYHFSPRIVVVTAYEAKTYFPFPSSTQVAGSCASPHLKVLTFDGTLCGLIRILFTVRV